MKVKKYLFIILSLFILSGCEERQIPEGMEEVPENEYLFAKTYDRIKKECVVSDIAKGKRAYNCPSKEVMIEEEWRDGNGKLQIMVKYWDENGREQYQMNAWSYLDRDLRPIISKYKNAGM